MYLGFQSKIMLLLSFYVLECLSFAYINLLLMLFIPFLVYLCFSLSLCLVKFIMSR